MEESRARFFYQKMQALLKPDPDVNLLDIGCNDGRFLNFAAKDWQTCGVDMDQGLLNEAKEIAPKSKVSLVNLDSEKLPFPDNTFDAVTMFDVIEHVSAPHAVMLEVRRVLKGHGLAVLVTPNAASLTKRLKGSAWVGIADATHRYLFTPFTLEFLLERAGFGKITTEAFTFTTQPLPVFIKSFANKVIGKSGGQLWAIAKK